MRRSPLVLCAVAYPDLARDLLLLLRQVVEALLRIVNLRYDLLDVLVDAYKVLSSGACGCERVVALSLRVKILSVPRRGVHLVCLQQRRLRLIDGRDIMMVQGLIQTALVLFVERAVEQLGRRATVFLILQVLHADPVRLELLVHLHLEREHVLRHDWLALAWSAGRVYALDRVIERLIIRRSELLRHLQSLMQRPVVLDRLAQHLLPRAFADRALVLLEVQGLP